MPAPAPAIRSERCVIHCLTCARSSTAATFVIEGLFGYLPYGQITGRLHCRKGCGDRYGVILPLDAPTPRQYALKYGMPPAPSKAEQPTPSALDADLQGALVEVGANGTFLKLYAKSSYPEILHWGFDFLLEKLSSKSLPPPHLLVMRGAQCSRDSQRSFKVVGMDGQPKDQGT